MTGISTGTQSQPDWCTTDLKMPGIIQFDLAHGRNTTHNNYNIV